MCNLVGLGTFLALVICECVTLTREQIWWSAGKVIAFSRQIGKRRSKDEW